MTVLCSNIEENGRGDASTRHRAAKTLRALAPSLILRQEMWGADTNSGEVKKEQEADLDLECSLGQRSCTAVFAHPDHFELDQPWPPGQGWEQPPTALSLRYRHAPADAMPLQVVSYHLNYASATKRLAEAEWLTTWTDKKADTASGETVQLPALLGGDNNSYPHQEAEGGPALPRLEKIADQPHRLHRSYVGPDGRRVPDDRPDEVLRAAGLIDAARYWATASGHTRTALAPTAGPFPSQGGVSRIDRVYLTRDIAAAIIGVDVIDVPRDLSDHHIVRLALDTGVLADILSQHRLAA